MNFGREWRIAATFFAAITSLFVNYGAHAQITSVDNVNSLRTQTFTDP